MADKTKQVSTTNQGEGNATGQQTDTFKTAQAVTDTSFNTTTETVPSKKSTTTVKPGGSTSTIAKEDYAFQIQFTIPVRGGLGSS